MRCHAFAYDRDYVVRCVTVSSVIRSNRTRHEKKVQCGGAGKRTREDGLYPTALTLLGTCEMAVHSRDISV
jgi:hypothetical protein